MVVTYILKHPLLVAFLEQEVHILSLSHLDARNAGADRLVLIAVPTILTELLGNLAITEAFLAHVHHELIILVQDMRDRLVVGSKCFSLCLAPTEQAIVTDRRCLDSADVIDDECAIILSFDGWSRRLWSKRVLALMLVTLVMVEEEKTIVFIIITVAEARGSTVKLEVIIVAGLWIVSSARRNGVCGTNLAPPEGFTQVIVHGLSLIIVRVHRCTVQVVGVKQLWIDDLIICWSWRATWDMARVGRASIHERTFARHFPSSSHCVGVKGLFDGGCC